MKLSQMFVKRLSELEVNSRGRFFGHQLAAEMHSAETFATRVDRDGSALVYIFPDRSRLRIDNPTQIIDRARFYQLSNVG